MIDPVVLVVLRCLLALLFVSAAWHKVSGLGRFVATIDAYQLLPSRLDKPLAALLISSEVALAFGMLLPLYRWAAFGAVGLLAIYSAAILINLVRGRREIDCGCFGPAARASLDGSLLVRNALLVGAAVVVSLPMQSRALTWMDGFSVCVIVAATALIWVSFWRLRNASAQLGGQS